MYTCCTTCTSDVLYITLSNLHTTRGDNVIITCTCTTVIIIIIPVPVAAHAQMSLPIKASGIVFACIGVGEAKPTLVIA